MNLNFDLVTVILVRVLSPWPVVPLAMIGRCVSTPFQIQNNLASGFSSLLGCVSWTFWLKLFVILFLDQRKYDLTKFSNTTHSDKNLGSVFT